jgi:hypothetical protein
MEHTNRRCAVRQITIALASFYRFGIVGLLKKIIGIVGLIYISRFGIMGLIFLE